MRICFQKQRPKQKRRIITTLCKTRDRQLRTADGCGDKAFALDSVELQVCPFRVSEGLLNEFNSEIAGIPQSLGDKNVDAIEHFFHS